jgi:hypothetical protein
MRSGTVSPVTEMAIPPKEWPTKTTCPGRPAISTTILSTIVPKVTFVSGVWSSPLTGQIDRLCAMTAFL